MKKEKELIEQSCLSDELCIDTVLKKLNLLSLLFKNDWTFCAFFATFLNEKSFLDTFKYDEKPKAKKKLIEIDELSNREINNFWLLNDIDNFFDNNKILNNNSYLRFVINRYVLRFGNHLKERIEKIKMFVSNESGKNDRNVWIEINNNNKGNNNVNNNANPEEMVTQYLNRIEKKDDDKNPSNGMENFEDNNKSLLKENVRKASEEIKIGDMKENNAKEKKDKVTGDGEKGFEKNNDSPVSHKSIDIKKKRKTRKKTRKEMLTSKKQKRKTFKNSGFDINNFDKKKGKENYSLISIVNSPNFPVVIRCIICCFSAEVDIIREYAISELCSFIDINKENKENKNKKLEVSVIFLIVNNFKEWGLLEVIKPNIYIDIKEKQLLTKEVNFRNIELKRNIFHVLYMFFDYSFNKNIIMDVMKRKESVTVFCEREIIEWVESFYDYEEEKKKVVRLFYFLISCSEEKILSSLLSCEESSILFILLDYCMS